MQSFFVTSTGTDIGKTLVTTTLCWQLTQASKKVTALKPVISGYNPKDEHCDSALILKSCGLSPTPALMETISPWHYALPLAPSMAAKKEGKAPVDFDRLVEYCREHTQLSNDILLVEGVGGIMAPLTESQTVLDWIGALEWPVILVSGSYLGAISDTLCAVEVLRMRGAEVRALIISGSENSAVQLNDTAETLQKFIAQDIPILRLPRISGKEELWKHMPLISWVCNV